MKVSIKAKFDVNRCVALMESPTTTTVISTRLPAIQGNISHLATVASAGRKIQSGFSRFHHNKGLDVL